jgi:hypothetical protein
MTSLRVSVICLFAFAALLFAGTASTQNRPALAEKTAQEFGIASWGKIEAIRYTFNLDFALGKISRTWTWEPKTGRVTYESKDKSGQPVKVTYLRSELNSQSADVKDNIEPSFMNDQYWLIFPFHVIWDDTPVVTDKGMAKLPLGNGTAEHLLVKYPSDVVYTPGDTWELFIGPDYRVREFIYRRGGPKKPSIVIATWTDYKKAGPLLVATDHRGTADGKPLRLTFSNVAVKLTGSDTWIDAQ